MNGILDFPDSFGGAGIRVLGTSRRSGARLLAATGSSPGGCRCPGSPPTGSAPTGS